MVIGTSTGLLYHCIAIEVDNKEEEGSDEGSELCQENVYSFTTSSGVSVNIPESVLYVLESIELSFPLTSTDLNQYGEGAEMYNGSEMNQSLQLIADKRDPKRYLVQHSFGVHIVLVSFLKQLLNQASQSTREYHDEQSVVEYLICTRPTIEKKAVFAAKSASFPVGVTLYISRGFTYIAVLLNSAELICKRLNNIVLPETIADGSLQRLSEITNEISSLLTPNKQSAKLSTSGMSGDHTASKVSNFPQHLEKILQRSTSLPLIKSSAKAKSAPIGTQELEMLLNAIDLLKKEYLEKFTLAAKAIEKRKKALRNICQMQVCFVMILKFNKI